MKTPALLTATLFSAATLLAAASGTEAANIFTWTGNAADDNWNNAANWDSPPSFARNTYLVFPDGVAAADKSTVQNTATATASQIKFETGGYTITGNPILLDPIKTTSPSVTIEAINFLNTGDNEVAVNISLSGAGAAGFRSTSGTATFSGASFSRKTPTFDGAGNFTFGSTTQVISDTDTRTWTFNAGTTRINGTSGRFIISNTLATHSLFYNGTTVDETRHGSVTIAGTLGGVGHLKTRVSTAVSLSGTLAPGDPLINGGVGVFTITSPTVNLNNNASLASQIVESGNDRLDVIGGFAFGAGTQTLDLSIDSAVGPGVYTLLTFTTGAFNGVFDVVEINGSPIVDQNSFFVNGFDASLTYTNTLGGGGSLVLNVIPEPASLALLGLGGLAIAGRPRRR